MNDANDYLQQWKEIFAW